MVELVLTPQHRANLRWSLQMLGMRQIMPASMGSLGVAQATMPTGQQGPLATVGLDGRKPQSMTESQSTATVEAEIANFEVEAYGAVLGVI